MILMCMCLCIQFTACNLLEDTDWIAQEAEKIGGKITCGEFVIDGEIFTFPMDLQDVLDKGWHISNNIDNDKTFLLEPGGTTKEFQLFPDDNHENSILVSVANLSDDKTTVDKCKVISIRLKENHFDYVLPGGLTRRNTQEDVENEYDEPMKVDEKDSKKEYTYTYTSKEGFECFVKLSVYNEENAKNPLSEVYYWTEPDEAAISNDVAKFINATMKVSYHNDCKEYVEYKIDTQEGAKALYMSEVEYYAYSIMEYADVNTECVTDEIYDQYCGIAKKVLSKVDWEISDIKEKGASIYTVELTIYPTNYFDVISDKVDGTIDDFNTKYENVDFNTLSDEEYLVVEIEYAKAILEAVKGLEKDIEAVSGVKRVYEFTDNGFSDSQWEEIDDIIMGVES